MFGTINLFLQTFILKMKIHSSHKDINCSIIDFHDRSFIANITDKNIAADLAKRMLQKAVKSQAGTNPNKFILIYQHYNHTKKAIFIRLHSYNNYQTSFKVHCRDINSVAKIRLECYKSVCPQQLLDSD
jgi:hypothetical protein